MKQRTDTWEGRWENRIQNMRFDYVYEEKRRVYNSNLKSQVLNQKVEQKIPKSVQVPVCMYAQFAQHHTRAKP